MLTPDDLHDFLSKNTITAANSDLVRSHLVQLESEGWFRGWMACEACHKKRRLLASTRRSKFIKTFLDYLSDKTHGK